MTESRTRTSTSGDVVHDAPGDQVDTTTTGEGATRLARSERMEREDGRPMQVSIAPPRRDRVRWGPVWAGLVVAVPTFLLLQLATLALGWWDIGAGDAGSDADLWSGINGLIALFLGGLTAGASALWRGISEGLLHGILVWALTVVTIVFLTLFGGGALFGSLAGVITDVAGISRGDVPEIQAAEAADTARSAASWAVLGLGLSILASTLGGVVGAKMWPSRKDVESDRVAVR